MTTRQITVIIPAGASQPADILDLKESQILGVFIPSNWTAAGISFQTSPDSGQNLPNVFDAGGNEYVLSASASTYVSLGHGPAWDSPLGCPLNGLRYLRPRSGTAGTPVNQTTESRLTFLVKDRSELSP